jgi:hypothetical protein
VCIGLGVMLQDVNQSGSSGNLVCIGLGVMGTASIRCKSIRM